MGGAGNVYSSNHHYQAFFNLSFVELRSPRPPAPCPPSASGLTSVGSLCRFHGERCPSASLVRTRMWGYLSPLRSFTRVSNEALCTMPLHYVTALFHCTLHSHINVLSALCTMSLHFVTALCDCNLHCHLNAHSALCTMSLHYVTALCHCTMSLHYVTALCHCPMSLHYLAALYTTISMHSISARFDYTLCTLSRHCRTAPSVISAPLDYLVKRVGYL